MGKKGKEQEKKKEKKRKHVEGNEEQSHSKTNLGSVEKKRRKISLSDKKKEEKKQDNEDNLTFNESPSTPKLSTYEKLSKLLEERGEIPHRLSGSSSSSSSSTPSSSLLLRPNIHAKKRIQNERNKLEESLDSLARLLAGNDECAVCVVNSEILITTNNGSAPTPAENQRPEFLGRKNHIVMQDILRNLFTVDTAIEKKETQSEMALLLNVCKLSIEGFNSHTFKNPEKNIKTTDEQLSKAIKYLCKLDNPKDIMQYNIKETGVFACLSDEENKTMEHQKLNQTFSLEDYQKFRKLDDTITQIRNAYNEIWQVISDYRKCKRLFKVFEEQGINSCKLLAIGEQGEHAEMRLAGYLLEMYELNPNNPMYIGISKLPCADCDIGFYTINENKKGHALKSGGTHGLEFGKSKIPVYLEEGKPYLSSNKLKRVDGKRIARELSGIKTFIFHHPAPELSDDVHGKLSERFKQHDFEYGKAIERQQEEKREARTFDRKFMGGGRSNQEDKKLHLRMARSPSPPSSPEFLGEQAEEKPLSEEQTYAGNFLTALRKSGKQQLKSPTSQAPSSTLFSSRHEYDTSSIPKAIIKQVQERLQGLEESKLKEKKLDWYLEKYSEDRIAAGIQYERLLEEVNELLPSHIRIKFDVPNTDHDSRSSKPSGNPG